MVFLVVTLLIICVIISLSVGIPAGINFVVHPESINTTDGTTVQFNCTADNNPHTLIFLVNETAISADHGENGFIELPPEDLSGGNGLRRRKLLVKASVANNSNSQISCQAFNNTYEIAIQNKLVAISNTATLLVQGPLSSVVDLSYFFLNSSAVNISWSPPFTLHGTDITGYNISVTTNGSTIDYFTSDSYYELLLTDIYHTACEITLTVSGYNSLVGRSYMFFVPSIKPTALLSVKVLKSLSLSLIINVNDVLCLGNYSTANISLMKGDELFESKLEVLGSTMNNLSDVFQLVEDQSYNIFVVYYIFGTKVVNDTNFDTFGVESVTYIHKVDGIVTIVCHFNSFSTDTGCTVQLVLQDNSSVHYTATFNRSGSIAEGNITVMSGGVYDILAFDEGSTVVAASLLGVNITGIPHPTITTTITSTSTTATESSSSMSISNTPSASPTSAGTLLFSITTIALITVSGVCGLLIIVIIVLLVIISRMRKKIKYAKNVSVTFTDNEFNAELSSYDVVSYGDDDVQEKVAELPRQVPLSPDTSSSPLKNEEDYKEFEKETKPSYQEMCVDSTSDDECKSQEITKESSEHTSSDSLGHEASPPK